MKFKSMNGKRKKVDELTKAHQHVPVKGENYFIRPFQDMVEVERGAAVPCNCLLCH